MTSASDPPVVGGSAEVGEKRAAAIEVEVVVETDAGVDVGAGQIPAPWPKGLNPFRPPCRDSVSISSTPGTQRG